MNREFDRNTIRQWATAIVSEVEPADGFIVRDNFDGLASAWSQAKPRDEGRFFGGAEVAPFAALIVPFLLGFVGDVTKGIVTDHAKKAVRKYLDKLLAHTIGREEADRLAMQINTAIDDSRFSDAEKKMLRDGFDKLFRRVLSTA